MASSRLCVLLHSTPYAIALLLSSQNLSLPQNVPRLLRNLPQRRRFHYLLTYLLTCSMCYMTKNEIYSEQISFTYLHIVLAIVMANKTILAVTVTELQMKMNQCLVGKKLNGVDRWIVSWS